MDTAKPIPKLLYETTTQRFSNAFLPHDIWCTCDECLSQFRTLQQQFFNRWQYVNGLSIAEAREVSQKYAGSIQSDLKYLREKLLTQGNTIVNRWKNKRSRSEREEILKVALPHMPAKNWFLYHTCNDDFREWNATLHLRTGLLLPYLSIESFRDDPYKLFALLYARTKFDPQDWVYIDKQQTDAGWKEGRLAVDFAECAVRLYGPGYGDIVEFDTSQAHRWDICAFPRAKIILEAQATVLSFLRHTVQIILGNGTLVSGPSDKWQELVENGFRRCIGHESWSRLGNQAFSAPVFDFDRLIDIAKAQYSEAYDHLWLLQTDFPYLQRFIKMASRSAIFRQSKNPNFLPNRIWGDPHNRAWEWGLTIEELQHAKMIHDKYCQVTMQGSALPQELEMALACLESYLIWRARFYTENLWEELARQTAFEHHFTFGYFEPRRILFASKKLCGEVPCKTLFKEDRLFQIFHMVTHDHETALGDPRTMFGQLDEWLADGTVSSEQRSRLQEQLLRDLSSFSAIYDILSSIRSFRPRFSSIDRKTALKYCSTRPAWKDVTPSFARIYTEELKRKQLAIFEKLQTNTFPKGKRDMEWLRCADKCRKLSEEFWANARVMQTWVDNLPSEKYSPEEKARKMNLLCFDQQPEHREFLETERERIFAHLSAPKPRLDVVYTDNHRRSESNDNNNCRSFLPKHSKEKVKTRPELESTAVDEKYSGETTWSAVLEGLPAVEHIFVKPQTLQITDRLFPRTTEEHAGKPVDWNTFVVALEDIGFLAAQSGGSAVTFVQEKLGRIVFHKPHPVTKIDQTTMQAWGKRLQKWFPWDRETFVAITKEAKA